MAEGVLIALRPTLQRVLALFDEMRIGGVVIGGIAASALGEPRHTADVDATMAVTNEDLERLFAVARNLGLEPRLSDHIEFARARRMILLQDVERSS